MKKSQIIGLVCGLALFVIIALFEFPGIGFAARIALAIFLLAAVFWITEPIPIYATSMLVIFLQMLLLSAEGVVFRQSEYCEGCCLCRAELRYFLYYFSEPDHHSFSRWFCFGFGNG